MLDTDRPAGSKGLVTNYGERGATKRKGEHVKFYPYEKGGGAEKVLAMTTRERKRFWGSFYAVVWSFSHIEGERKKFPLFKGGCKKF